MGSLISVMLRTSWNHLWVGGQHQERTNSLTSIKAHVFVTDLTRVHILTHVLAVASTEAQFVLGGQPYGACRGCHEPELSSQHQSREETLP